jgi:hypothetical protein
MAFAVYHFWPSMPVLTYASNLSALRQDFSVQTIPLMGRFVLHPV